MLWRTAVQLAQRALPRLVVETGRWVVPGRLPVSSAAAQSPEELGWLSGETGTTVPGYGVGWWLGLAGAHGESSHIAAPQQRYEWSLSARSASLERSVA